MIDADGTILGIYRKLHIPHDPFFYEKSYFEEGDLGYKVFQTRYLRLAVLICYDQWFPEAARAASLAGAEVLFYPTAIGYLKNDPLPYTDWLNAWITIQRGHAIANSVHVAVANRVGTEGQVTFWGNSFVCNAFGKFLKKAGTKEETAHRRPGYQSECADSGRLAIQQESSSGHLRFTDWSPFVPTFRHVTATGCRQSGKSTTRYGLPGRKIALPFPNRIDRVRKSFRRNHRPSGLR